MPGDDVGHVARQQPVTILLGVQQPEAGARQRFGAKRKPGGVKRSRNDAQRGQRADFRRRRFRCRQHVLPAKGQKQSC
jgi:hypothetical protein